MARLIEIDGPFQGQVTLRTGDVLQLAASGANISAGDDVIELLGPFFPAVMVSTGEIIEAVGSADKVMLLARKPGNAIIQTFWGDAWNTPTIITNVIIVE